MPDKLIPKVRSNQPSTIQKIAAGPRPHVLESTVGVVTAGAIPFPVNQPVWVYAHVVLIRVIDGDTIVVDIDQGLRQWRHIEVIRMYGYNAPELHDKDKAMADAGYRSKAALEDLLTSAVVDPAVGGRSIRLTTLRIGPDGADSIEKYGRLLGWIDIRTVSTDATVPTVWRNVNNWMVDSGFAKPYDGKGPKP